MQEKSALVLDGRGVIRVSGGDRNSFLQGIVSADVEKITQDRSGWSAFLTPQGKFLHEFFLCADGDSLLIDCEAARLADLKRRLSLYRLRSKVTIEDCSDNIAVAAFYGAGALAALELAVEPGHTTGFGSGRIFVDPRLAELGARAVLARQSAADEVAASGFSPGSQSSYDRLRISLGIPDGSRDMEVEKSTLLENGFDELGGVDWQKGCFLGQELTARTKYRALIKKRLLPVTLQGPPPVPGTAIVADGREVGVMRSSVEGLGLALLRLDKLESTSMAAGDCPLRPEIPDWVRIEKKI